MRTVVRKIHKCLGLGFSVFWLLQAASGILLVFHRPLDDSLLGASGRSADLQVIDETIQDIERQTPGTNVIQYFPSGGIAGQIDILVENGDDQLEVIRVDGSTGSILRTSAWTTPAAELNVFRFLLLFHKELLAGTVGHWLIGVSGMLLFTNVVLGLKLAWPKSRQWRRALVPRRAGTPVAGMFAGHRAIGLWLAPLGLLIALTGLLLVSRPALEQAFGAGVPLPPPNRSVPQYGSVVPPSAAVTTALGAYPDASLAGASMPNPSSPWYTVMVRQPGELRRVYGTTVVYIDAHSGKVIETHDVLTASPLRKFLMALWPIHSGEWGGTATRLLTLVTGLWLITTICFGLKLWWARRQTPSPRKRTSSVAVDARA